MSAADASVRIARLFHYPVKSMAGIEVDSLAMDALGPLHDRRWMAVDAQGRFLSQRRFPDMARIQALPGDVPEQLTLQHPESGRIDVPGVRGETISVQVWADRVEASCTDAAVDRWLSACLGVDCRLVYFGDAARRRVTAPDGRVADVAFADGYPLLITTEASLNDLNSQLPAPVSIRRFRPNVHLQGAKPGDEYRWTALACGESRIELLKPCQRCVMTTVDPDAGQRAGVEPFDTLKRLAGAGKPLFGVNGAARAGVIVRTGALWQIVN